MKPTFLDTPTEEILTDYDAVRDPELARRRNVFIAEGRLVVSRLLTSSPLIVKSVVVTAAAAQSIGDALAARADVPVYVVSQETMNRVAGFNIHRGCLAVGERPAPRHWAEIVGHANRIVVLEHVGDADNVGSIFRSAAAFEADAVLIGPRCADPLYRKAIRTSMGAALTLPFAEAAPWPATLRALTDGGWTVAGLTPSADAVPLHQFSGEARMHRVGLVLGHEGGGLTAEALALCSDRVRIPIRASVDSLNVATAAAIALYELKAQGPRPKA